jgi:RimJ/RimL family protein N-acetyltransferase
MPAKIKENVFPKISQLRLRPLTQYDFKQFKETIRDSRDSISTFLNMGIEVPDLNIVDFMNFYSSLLRDKEVQHFGVFHGYKMLAYACFCPAFDLSGVQIIYFVREEFLRQNIGTYTLFNMTHKAWLEQDAHFVQAVIDKANIGSRAIVRSQGYEAIYALTALGQGTLASNTQICYIWINPKLRMKAASHEMRAIDLIGHFCFIPGLDHLIFDQKVNELFRWKAPIYKEDDLELFQSK